jgi:hypothetical protein
VRRFTGLHPFFQPRERRVTASEQEVFARLKGGAMQDRKSSRYAGRVAVVFAVATVAAPGAQARHAPPEPVANSPVGLDAATRHHHNLGPARRPATVIAVQTAGGFDWGDAGIGAAAGIGAVLVASGSALVLRHNRQQPRQAVRRA